MPSVNSSVHALSAAQHPALAAGSNSSSSAVQQAKSTTNSSSSSSSAQAWLVLSQPSSQAWTHGWMEVMEAV
jgi:hypothetical protein